MTAYTPIKLPAQPEEARGDGLDLPWLWSVFRRRFRLFLSAALLTCAAVVILTFQLTPLYEAEARIIINSRETQALDYSAIIAGISPDAAAVETEVEVILSRSAAEKVAERLNLFTDPEFGVAPQGLGGLSRFAPSQLRRGPLPEAARRAVTIDRLTKAVEAERAGITYVVVLTATSEDPEKAAMIANAFAEQYLTDGLDQKFETYDRVSTYLADATQEAQAEMRVADDAVEAYRTETGLLSAEGTLLSEQQVSDLQAQLIVQEADLADRRAKLTTLTRRLEQGGGADATTAVLASPVIGALRAQQAELTRRRAELETRYGPLHPQIDKVASEAADLEAQIATETARIVENLSNEVRVAESRVGTLRERIERLERELGTDNVALVRLRELEREAEVARRNWEALTQRSGETAQLTGLVEADARISASAVPPVDPAFPNHALNLALGVILGTLAGGLAVVLAELFDDGIRTGADVERQLGLNLVTAVPELVPAKMGQGGDPAAYLTEKPLSAFAESYRTLRSALTMRGAEARPRVIAVSSAVPGEGKTVSALCLARIAALSGDRAIIIDCDLRRRVLSEAFAAAEEGVGEERGLAEVLAGEVPLRSALRKDALSTLEVLPVSEDRSGLGDLLGSPRFGALLGRLKERYDLVVLDTPPLTAVADARVAVRAADAAVLCVRWKETTVPLAKAARKVLDETGTPVIGAVLTRVDQRAQAGYGYEGSARYYAQHGRYYFD